MAIRIFSKAAKLNEHIDDKERVFIRQAAPVPVVDRTASIESSYSAPFFNKLATEVLSRLRVNELGTLGKIDALLSDDKLRPLIDVNQSREFQIHSMSAELRVLHLAGIDLSLWPKSMGRGSAPIYGKTRRRPVPIQVSTGSRALSFFYCLIAVFGHLSVVMKANTPREGTIGWLNKKLALVAKDANLALNRVNPDKYPITDIEPLVNQLICPLQYESCASVCSLFIANVARTNI